MADEIDPPTSAEDGPSFADAAMAAYRAEEAKVTTEKSGTAAEAAAVKEQPVKKTEPPAKSSVPEGVFEDIKPVKKDEPAKVDAVESEMDKIPDPEFKDAKRKAQWEEVKTKGKEFEKQAREAAQKLAAMEKKISDFEAAGKNTAALEEKLAALQKENEQNMSLVRQVNIELDPEFRKTFVDGRKNFIDQAKEIVEESGGNAKDIETALNLTGKSRVEALSAVAEGMSAFQQGRLGRVVDALTELDKSAAEKRSNPEQYLAQLQKEEQARTLKATEDRAKHMSLSYDEALSKVSSEIEVLRRVEGMTDWNEQADAIKRRAKENWNGQLDMTTAASKFIAAEAMPVFRQLFIEQRKESVTLRNENAELKKELEGLYRKGPGLQGGGASKAGAPTDWASDVVNRMNGTTQ